MSCANCGDKKNSLTSRLNKRVTIMRQTDETNQYNERLDIWYPVADVWAAIEPLRGQEYFAAMAEHAEVTTRIRIRYRQGIDRMMRVQHGAAEFEILHIIHPEFGKKELQLMCKERQ